MIGLESLLIVKSGYIIKEEYFNGWDEETDHPLYSVTKSFTSAIIGIAIDNGLISLANHVLDYFPNRTFQNVNTWKKDMNIEHLLQMRSGIAWDEWNISYADNSNMYRQMMVSLDPLQFILDKPMASEPGSDFVYNSGCGYLLLAILQQTINQSINDYANEVLFERIGIDLSIWTSSADDIPFGGSSLYLIPRDMARFGYLFLNNGTWDGHQIISHDWINKSVYEYQKLIEWDDAYYGLHWWIDPTYYGYFSYSARGYLGQRIQVFPELDAVIVFTGSRNQDYQEVLTDFIIPALAESTEKETAIAFLPIILGISILTLRKIKTQKGRLLQ